MTVTKERSGAPPRLARAALLAIFFANGAGLATWVARIPAVKDGLGIGEGALGAALLAAPAGLFLMLAPISALVVRYGSHRVTRWTAVLYCCVLPLPGLAPNFPALVVALLALGAGNGALDLSMNAQTVTVEKAYGRPILASVHGMFSAGGIAGAGAGGLAAGAGIAARPHFLATAAVLLMVMVIATRPLVDDAGHERGEPVFARPTGPLVGLGVIAFCALLAEGAVADWSAVYLTSTLNTSPGLAASGFAAFSVAMTIGRLSGDRLSMWLGSDAVVRAGGLVAMAGMGLALAVPSAAVAIAGFGLVGLGIASMFPLVLSAAGRTPGMRPPVALAAATSAGYLGLLAGPPVIGFAAELLSLRTALGIVLICGAVATALARRLEPGRRARLAADVS